MLQCVVSDVYVRRVRLLANQSVIVYVTLATNFSGFFFVETEREMAAAINVAKKTMISQV